VIVVVPPIPAFPPRGERGMRVYFIFCTFSEFHLIVYLISRLRWSVVRDLTPTLSKGEGVGDTSRVGGVVSVRFTYSAPVSAISTS
jgi:hypothetical protein